MWSTGGRVKHYFTHRTLKMCPDACAFFVCALQTWQENKLVFQSVPTGTAAKCRCLRGNGARQTQCCFSQSEVDSTNPSGTWCLSVSFVSPSGFLSASLLTLSWLHVTSKNLNLAANKNNIVHIVFHSTRLIYTYHYMLWLYFTLCCIFQLNHLWWYMICVNVWVRACHLYKTTNGWIRKIWIFSDLFKWGGVVALVTDVIKWYCVMATCFLVTCLYTLKLHIHLCKTSHNQRKVSCLRKLKD